ncbi:MAG: HAD-IA family hydrolase [Capnocytophaga sp.]|nr:HAD-IA family hydrolase [Capnocytophaga sp.]
MNYFIFDMDGVLVDSEPMHKKILRQVCQSLGIDLSQEYFESLTGMAAIPMWAKIKEDTQRNESPEELTAYHREFFFEKLPSAQVPEVAGVKEVIQKLKANNYSLSVASSSPRRLIDYFTQQIDIQSYFDYIISGAELQRSKPFPDIFLKVATFYDVPPERFWVMEDSKHGVAAAKSAGMNCIGFQNPNSGSQDLSQADIIIPSMSVVTNEFIQKLAR